MIRMLTGLIADQFEEGVVLNVSGVGYEVFVGSAVGSQAVVGREITLYVYTHVKEEALQLYGFLSGAERKLFTQMLSVSGVGPKSALHIVDRGVSAVQAAVRGSDVAFFQDVPRLGKKTSQKIIVELQSKLGKESELELLPVGSVKADVRDALMGLGYDDRSIQPVVSKLDESLSLDEALRQALKSLGGR